MGKREQPAFRCNLHVLKDVNLEVAEGEKLVIIGPSGSGKSTTVLKNLTLAPMKLHHKTKQEAEELPRHKRHPLWIEQPMGDGGKAVRAADFIKKEKAMTRAGGSSLFSSLAGQAG